MDSAIFKKIIFLLLLPLFFICNSNVYALTLTDTENVTVSARVGEEVVPTPGGPSGGIAFPKTAVIFKGEAYPNATVFFLQGGKERSSVLADSNGYFDATLEESYDSNVLYTLFAKDVSGNRSLLINYPIVVRVGFITQLSGIRFAPTIVTDRSQVKLGDYLTVSGYAMPGRNMEVIIEGDNSATFTLVSSSDGSYKTILPLKNFPKGNYIVHVKYESDKRISKLVKFTIGDTNIPSAESVESIPGDCNLDKVINLTDFSVLAFWYGKANPPRCVDTNADNVINLIDFSILAFYWTG